MDKLKILYWNVRKSYDLRKQILEQKESYNVVIIQEPGRNINGNIYRPKGGRYLEVNSTRKKKGGNIRKLKVGR